MVAPVHYQNSSQVGKLVFGQTISSKPCKNHALENVRAIREAERRNKERSTEVKVKQFKLKQFQDIPSRIHTERATATSSEKPFLRRGSGEAKPKAVEVFKKRIEEQSKLHKVPETLQKEEPKRTPRKSAIPRERAALKPRSQTNFLAKNRSTTTFPIIKKEVKTMSTDHHHEVGTIPTYLLQRKKELAAKRRLEASKRADPAAPPGTVQMAEKDRLEMLNKFKEQHDSIQSAINRLPLALTTIRQQNHKASLEAQLDKVNTSIALFDKPVVYIQEDDDDDFNDYA